VELKIHKSFATQYSHSISIDVAEPQRQESERKSGLKVDHFFAALHMKALQAAYS